jgi:hypothetical protein
MADAIVCSGKRIKATKLRWLGCVWNFDETVCVAKGDVRRDYKVRGIKGSPENVRSTRAGRVGGGGVKRKRIARE